MKDISFGRLYGELHNRNRHYPWQGLIELTYRCNLDCVHCYCQGLENRDKELKTLQWKKILQEIHQQGCTHLTLTGGEPLVRDDFLELYAYAKEKGFIVSIFTNGQRFTKKILEYLSKASPYSIEITLNGITKDVYESITQVAGSFARVMAAIRELKRRHLPLILKSNCLKQNKDEIARIKAFADNLLGKGKGRYHFKFDPMIYPCLNRDKTPCNFRLSFKEMLELRRQDADVWQEYQAGLKMDFPDMGRERDFLFRCNAWMSQFFINPYGRLKFCQFSERFSSDLKATSFHKGFYKIFPQLLKQRFKTNSPCRDCSLRAICYHCPARAYLETGDEEAPVPYFCELAEAAAKYIRKQERRFSKTNPALKPTQKTNVQV